MFCVQHPLVLPCLGFMLVQCSAIHDARALGRCPSLAGLAFYVYPWLFTIDSLSALSAASTTKPTPRQQARSLHTCLPFSCSTRACCIRAIRVVRYLDSSFVSCALPCVSLLSHLSLVSPWRPVSLHSRPFQSCTSLQRGRAPHE